MSSESLRETGRVQIIGLGVVGSAQEYLMQHLGYRTVGYDPLKNNTSLETDVDVTFICTPEAVVEDVVAELVKVGVKGLYVIKSTVPVGTTRHLMQEYGIHICHNPEFLREGKNIEDVMNPSRVVIGECCKEHGDFLREIYCRLDAPIFRTDPTTSELIKLVSNTLRAISISFWNELYLLCEKVGADINVIAEAANPAKVLGEWEGGKWGTRVFGRPYEGKCLPKDIKHLIRIFRDYGLNPEILEASEHINHVFGGR